MRHPLYVLATALVMFSTATAVAAADPAAGAVRDLATLDGIWIERSRLEALPTQGPAWDNLAKVANRPIGVPNLSDQNDMANVHVLANALVYARTGDETHRRKVIEALRAAPGSEAGARSLSVARELSTYVIAADLVKLSGEDDAAFRTWLRAVRETDFEGRTLISTNEDRPNNWGLHAGASRLAVALYLREPEEVARVATIFRGWLGDRAAYTEFRYGDKDWQSAPDAPVGVNPVGARIGGHDVDGVLPDDQRRCCDRFTWPPPHENYVYEALQGALLQAMLLDRAGYDVWNWQDKALLRAFRWLYQTAKFPAKSDDTWQPWVINHAYGSDFPVTLPTRPGKAIGWTDWTHAAR